MTDHPRSILAAVDFGDASGRAISIAGTLAERFGASLRLLHAGAFDVPPHLGSGELAGISAGDEVNRNRVAQFLTDFGRRHTKSAFAAVVDEGAPVDVILRESTTSDLVAMGTHGRRGPSRWLLGSVAERVLREVGRPLLIARASVKTFAPEEVFSRVLVYASAPLTGVAAMQYAGMLAERFDGRVVDARYEPVEPALERTSATLLAVAAPLERAGVWLSNIGEPIVRFCDRPILFVPESGKG